MDGSASGVEGHIQKIVKGLSSERTRNPGQQKAERKGLYKENLDFAPLPPVSWPSR